MIAIKNIQPINVCACSATIRILILRGIFIFNKLFNMKCFLFFSGNVIMVSRTTKNVLDVSLMLSTHCINEYTDVVYSINRFTYIMTYEHLLLNTVYYMISYPCLSIQTYHIIS